MTNNIFFYAKKYDKIYLVIVMLKDKKVREKIFLISYGIILFVLLINYQWLFKFLNVICKALYPFLIGFIIAFILNVLVKSIEEKFLKKMKKYKRLLSVSSSLIIVIGFIVFLLAILIPQIHNAGTIFIENIPQYQDNLYSLGEKFGLSYEQLEFLDIEKIKIKEKIVILIKDNKDTLIGASMGVASSVISAVTSFFIGLIFAVYLLMDKERLCGQLKKLLKAISKNDIYNKIVEVVKLSDVTFSNFVKVQVFEAFILGVLCFFGMLLLRIPYAATISVLVGVTALIPVFGGFIGCIVGAFLIFMINPLKSLTFILFFLVLQQIEGNFIYPKVVGNKIGLPSIWVLVAVTIGGSCGGVLGMLIGVPIISIVYSLLKIFVNKRYKDENDEENGLKR